MQKIYLQLIDQAVADGVITPEQYLQIPWDECGSMRYLFSPAGRQAIAAGIITFKEYLRIPCEERKSMKYLFSSGGRHALADGIITLEQYLEISLDERESMEYLFSLDGRQTVAENIITLKQYLQIPCEERKSMKYFFSHDVRQAVADGIITLERYLQIPSRERKDAMTVLQNPNTRRISCDVRQALADGIITLEKYLKIPRDERDDIKPLFSRDGRQALADGIITLEQYLQIPWYERQNVMTALQDPWTRQRIINGEITTEEIIGISPVPNINGAQSTHTPSVHQTVSESAARLAKLYKSSIDGAGLESVIEKVKVYIDRLPDDSLKNQAAKRGFLRIVAPSYTFTDSRSEVTIRQLLALAFLAMHDDEKRVGSLEDTQIQFVEGLYEIQRGYNLLNSAIDQSGEDRYICSAGTFNKLIEKLEGIHPDCRILFITKEMASLKLPIVVREEAMQYLTTFAKPDTAGALRKFTNLIAHVKKEGVEVIWEHIKEPIATRMWDEFGSLYRDRTDPDFTALVEAGKDGEFDLSTFQEQVERDYLSEHRSDGLEAQKEDTISPEEIFLVEVGKDVKLDDLNTFQEQVQNGYLNEHRSDGSETHKEEVGVIDLQKLIYAKSILLELKKLENKAKNLRDRNHILAYCKAANIVQLLRGLNQDYFTEKKIDYKTYKEKSLAIINQECPELDKHRGYKQILGNLLILILTLGTAQLINKACAGNFLFFKKTDSSKLIDNVSHTIEKMEFGLMI